MGNNYSEMPTTKIDTKALIDEYIDVFNLDTKIHKFFKHFSPWEAERIMEASIDLDKPLTDEIYLDSFLLILKQASINVRVWRTQYWGEEAGRSKIDYERDSSHFTEYKQYDSKFGYKHTDIFIKVIGDCWEIVDRGKNNRNFIKNRAYVCMTRCKKLRLY